MRPLALIVALAGCAEAGLPDAPPEIPTCTPHTVHSVEFEVAVGDVDRRTLPIYVRCPSGAGAVDILAVSVEGAPAVTVASHGDRVTPSHPAEVSLVAAPTARGPIEGVLVITFSSGAPALEVPILGAAVGPAIPLDPAILLPPVDPGCESHLDVSLTNTGDRSTRDLRFELSDGAFRADFTLPRELNDGETWPLTLRARHPDESPTSARLGVWSHGQEIATSDLHFFPNTLERREERFTASVIRPMTTVIVFYRDDAGMNDNAPAALLEVQAFAERVVATPGARLAVIGDTKGCVIGPDRWIDARMSGSEARAAVVRMLDLELRYARWVRDLPKQLGDAVTPSAVGSGGCNAGLLDGDPHVQIVYVTDRGAAPSTSPMVPPPLDSWRPSSVVVHAVVGDVPLGCYNANAGEGYYEASVETGGKFYSICAEEPWGSDLPLPARRPVDAVYLDLAEIPDWGRVEVWIDNVAYDRWARGSSDRELILPVGDVREGADVRVRYALPARCPP